MRAAPSPPAAAPLRSERLSDRLAALLVAQIESSGLQPGDRLPTEAELSKAHGVSRSVVREALHQVKSRGLLTSRQGSGVFVAPPPAHRPLQFDPTVLDSMDAVLQVMELRRALEGEIAALAAARATRTQVAGLRRALRTLDEAVTEGRVGVEEDFAFHRAIGEATGNPQFVRLLAFIEQYLLEAMRVTKGNEARRPEWMNAVRAEHVAIVDAIAAGDAEGARRAAADHLLRGHQRLEEGGVIKRARSSRSRVAAVR